MYSTYIIYSKKYDRYYVGSAEDVGKRLIRHNAGKVKSTKAFVPWELVYQEIYETRSQAYKRELQIKSYKGGRAFKDLIGKGQIAPPKTPSRHNKDDKSGGVPL